MNPIPVIPRLLALSLLGACLVSCGAADVDPEPAGAGDEADVPAGIEMPSEADRAAAEEELGRVTAALGEPTCGDTPVDASLDTGVNGYVYSPNATYDHPTCRNAFVVEMNGLTAGQTVYGGPESQATLEPFSCLFHWVHGSLWKKQASGSYTKVLEDNRVGTFQVVWRMGFACQARFGLPVTEDGDYKLVVSAGYLFGLFRKVDATAY